MIEEKKRVLCDVTASQPSDIPESKVPSDIARDEGSCDVACI